MEKKRITHLLILISIVAVSSFCALVSRLDKDVKGTEDAEALDVTTTPTSVPTLAPTNLVKLDDSGDPLPPKPIFIYPSGGQEIGSNGFVRVQFDQPMDAKVCGEMLVE